MTRVAVETHGRQGDDGNHRVHALNEEGFIPSEAGDGIVPCAEMPEIRIRVHPAMGRRIFHVAMRKMLRGRRLALVELNVDWGRTPELIPNGYGC